MIEQLGNAEVVVPEPVTIRGRVLVDMAVAVADGARTMEVLRRGTDRATTFGRRPPTPRGQARGISTVAPSIRACAIASGTSRRSRRYRSVSKMANGGDDNSRYAMNLVSKVRGMKANDLALSATRRCECAAW
jgi:hypothetical protein